MSRLVRSFPDGNDDLRILREDMRMLRDQLEVMYADAMVLKQKIRDLGNTIHSMTGRRDGIDGVVRMAKDHAVRLNDIDVTVRECRERTPTPRKHGSLAGASSAAA